VRGRKEEKGWGGIVRGGSEGKKEGGEKKGRERKNEKIEEEAKRGE